MKCHKREKLSKWPLWLRGGYAEPLKQPSNFRRTEIHLSGYGVYRDLTPILQTLFTRKSSADLSRRIRTCGQNKLNAHPFGEERVDVGFEDQWIDNSSMADREPTLTVNKNGQRHSLKWHGST
jgi:hypothetical protein